MRKIFIFFFFLLSVFFSKAQTADEVVMNYINALGGVEKLDSIKSVTMTGSLVVQGLNVDVTITALNGKGSRTDISVPGMDEGFQIYTPTKGWSYLPFQGQTTIQQMSDEQLKAGLGQLDVHGPLFNYKEKGNKIELLGTEMFNGMNCYKLKVETSYGKLLTYFIDSKSYYKVKVVSANPSGGAVETTFSNYKKNEQGYIMPFSQTNVNGTIDFSTIEINKPIDEKIFSGS